MEDDCLQAIKIMHHHANGRFDWLISGHQGVDPSREVILYCLANTKDLRLSILWWGHSIVYFISSRSCHASLPAREFLLKHVEILTTLFAVWENRRKYLRGLVQAEKCSFENSLINQIIKYETNLPATVIAVELGS